MDKAELQRLAEDRILDAQALLAAGRWSAAYYLAGYAVECALKACVLGYVMQTGAEVIFQDRRYTEKCWTHDIEELVKLSDLKKDWDTDCTENQILEENWATVKDWTEKSRYERKSQIEAQKLFEAINDKENGVLQWVKRHY